MAAGSRELTRRATAHLAGLAFAVTYLAATALGGGPGTALLRGSLVAAVALVAGQLLCRPVVDAVLDAAARDEARRTARADEDES
jgi:uncharacterized membrane protein YhiD involved in acid resistance